MQKSTSKHEKVASRLAFILMKLYRGETFSKTELVTEFKVHERTIYRDINRLGNIIVTLPDGRYQLAEEYKDKLYHHNLSQTHGDIVRTLSVSSIHSGLHAQVIEIVLWISAEIAADFKKDHLLPNQVILSQNADYSLVVSTQISDLKDILPFIQFWIPNVKVQAPADAKTALKEILWKYFARSNEENF